jgi:Macrocin-O-methyltransferase (TylF)/Methyltransferase domain
MAHLPDERTPDELEFMPIWTGCQPHTMTSFERGFALYKAVRHIVDNNIAGAIVECGVWKGGSSMIVMKTLIALGHPNRTVFMLDTFEGMTEPSAADVDHYGQTAAAVMEASRDEKETSIYWAFASLEQVQANIASTGYPAHLVRMIKGDVRQTLPVLEMGSIALLRLDTDFQDSTEAELVYLYPKLAVDGVLIIDDYGHWQGARMAVETYFDKLQQSGEPRPLLQRVDYTGRMAVRPRRAAPASDVRYDYHPQGLVSSPVAALFPTVVPGDPRTIPWPYLRTEVPHLWRFDTRSIRDPQTGVLSVEEAELLYNNALQFKGKRGLEIGCHYGWSGAHLRAAGLRLDLIDPALKHADQLAAVADSLEVVKDALPFSLWAGYSPAIVPAVRSAGADPWSFVFIDGYHEGLAPKLDAEAVAGCCAETACVMFHDLTSPFVANGLRQMAHSGWNVGLYNTMQIMGIAWRGNWAPVTHVADRNMPPASHSHLAEFKILSVGQT